MKHTKAAEGKKMGGFTVVTHELDPLDKFAKARSGALREAMGLIPYFVIEASTRGPKGAQDTLDYMNEAYGFAIGMNMTGGTVEEDGTYRYPEDPDMYPIASFKLFEGGTDEQISEVLIYQYAIVAVRDNKETLVTRMD